MEALRKAWNEIAESVIRPVKDWILTRSWPTRLGFLILTAIAAYGVWWPSDFKQKLNGAGFAMRVIVSGEGVIPVSDSAKHDLARGIARLAQTVEADLAAIDEPGTTPWSASQAVASLALLGKQVPGRDYSAFVNRKRAGACFCWRERPERSSDEIATFISGWVSAAYAETGRPLSSGDLDYLLGIQNRAGWWPMFPEGQGARFASTYSTAWVVLGLLRQRDKRLIPESRRARVDAAIARGVSWLLAARSPGARWKLYPNEANSPQSESVSGLVLYVLHAAEAQAIEDVDQEWLDNLPASDLEPAAVENQYFELRAEDGISIDHFVQVRLPWILAATAKAYRSGTARQKARTLAWLERVIEQPSVRSADTNSLNWVRAELLLGLLLTSREMQD